MCTLYGVRIKNSGYLDDEKMANQLNSWPIHIANIDADSFFPFDVHWPLTDEVVITPLITWAINKLVQPSCCIFLNDFRWFQSIQLPTGPKRHQKCAITAWLSTKYSSTRVHLFHLLWWCAHILQLIRSPEVIVIQDHLSTVIDNITILPPW